jgi:hypothetical protein
VVIALGRVFHLQIIRARADRQFEVDFGSLNLTLTPQLAEE